MDADTPVAVLARDGDMTAISCVLCLFSSFPGFKRFWKLDMACAYADGVTSCTSSATSSSVSSSKARAAKKELKIFAEEKNKSGARQFLVMTYDGAFCFAVFHFPERLILCVKSGLSLPSPRARGRSSSLVDRLYHLTAK